ncbi:MAG: hypothetical protein Kow0098_08700 [Ignavibacteriaceae bacterium]
MRAVISETNSNSDYHRSSGVLLKTILIFTILSTAFTCSILDNYILSAILRNSSFIDDLLLKGNNYVNLGRIITLPGLEYLIIAQSWMEILISTVIILFVLKFLRGKNTFYISSILKFIIIVVMALSFIIAIYYLLILMFFLFRDYGSIEMLGDYHYYIRYFKYIILGTLAIIFIYRTIRLIFRELSNFISRAA